MTVNFVFVTAPDTLRIINKWTTYYTKHLIVLVFMHEHWTVNVVYEKSTAACNSLKKISFYSYSSAKCTYGEVAMKIYEWFSFDIWYIGSSKTSI